MGCYWALCGLMERTIQFKMQKKAPLIAEISRVAALGHWRFDPPKTVQAELIKKRG
jgi:hypothetical protein